MRGTGHDVAYCGLSHCVSYGVWEIYARVLTFFIIDRNAFFFLQLLFNSLAINMFGTPSVTTGRTLFHRNALTKSQ